MSQLESLTIVLYDIPHDRTRTKAAAKCSDFGLARFQYSAFQGMLSRNRREELALALEQIIEVYGGLVTLIPVCAADCDGRIDLFVEPPQREPALNLTLFHAGTDDNPAPSEDG